MWNKAAIQITPVAQVPVQIPGSNAGGSRYHLLVAIHVKLEKCRPSRLRFVSLFGYYIFLLLSSLLLTPSSAANTIILAPKTSHFTMMPPYYMHGPYGGMPPELYQFPNPLVENASQPIPSRFEQYPYQQPHYSAPHHMQALPEFVPPGRGDHLPHRVPHAPQFVMAPPWTVPIPFYFALPDVSNSVSKDGQKKPPVDSKEEGKKDSGVEVPKDAKAKKGVFGRPVTLTTVFIS
jgi:hypothetical protein